MIQFLQKLGASCYHFNRSQLARRIFGIQTFPAPWCRGTLLDIPVMQGDTDKIQSLRDSGEKVDLSQGHWTEFVVQHYFLNIKRVKTIPAMEANTNIPREIILIIYGFCDDWADIVAELAMSTTTGISC